MPLISGRACAETRKTASGWRTLDKGEGCGCEFALQWTGSVRC